MAADPLNATEERAWRAVSKLMILMPRQIDLDMQKATGMSMTAFAVLLHLSEAPDHRLRISDLAERTAMSPSRMTRVVQALEADGLVSRAPGVDDGRASVAALTDAGHGTFSRALPAHIDSVRRRIIDPIEADELPALAGNLEQLVGKGCGDMPTRGAGGATRPGAGGRPA
jgi:DNA-binding MarR family transcriptional regulator